MPGNAETTVGGGVRPVGRQVAHRDGHIVIENHDQPTIDGTPFSHCIRCGKNFPTGVCPLPDSETPFIEADVAVLGALVKDTKPFSEGAVARLRGQPCWAEDESFTVKYDTDLYNPAWQEGSARKLWVDGWHWADRIVNALEMLYQSGAQ